MEVPLYGAKWLLNLKHYATGGHFSSKTNSSHGFFEKAEEGCIHCSNGCDHPRSHSEMKMKMTRGTVTHVNRGPSGHEVRRAACAAALNALNSHKTVKWYFWYLHVGSLPAFLCISFHFISFPLQIMPSFFSRPGGINPPVEPARDYLGSST